MFTRGLILFALAISLWACGNSGEENAADTAQEQAGATSEANGQTFGDAVTAEGAINYEDLYQQMNAADSLPAKVIGMVDQVCQVKGCWMDIVALKEGRVAWRGPAASLIDPDVLEPIYDVRMTVHTAGVVKLAFPKLAD